MTGVTLRWTYLLAPSLLALGSCGPRGGTDVGNGANVTFDVHGYERKEPATKSLTLGSGDVVDELWIAVEQFQVRKGANCSDSDDENGEEPVAQGPFIAEVIEGGIVGGLPSGMLDPGAYCRVRLDLHELEKDEVPAGAPAELAGATVFMRGTRADGVPFTVTSKQSFEFRLDAKEDSFEVVDGRPFFVGIELGALVAALELDTLSGATLIVDPENNTPELQAFEKALREASRLFEDKDKDGELTSSESGDDDELAVGK